MILIQTAHQRWGGGREGRRYREGLEIEKDKKKKKEKEWDERRRGETGMSQGAERRCGRELFPLGL